VLGYTVEVTNVVRRMYAPQTITFFFFLLNTLAVKRYEFKESYRYRYIDIVIPIYSCKMSASVIVLDFQIRGLHDFPEMVYMDIF
jgi:hypothetical protein